MSENHTKPINWGAIISNNLRTIIAIISFVGALYVQSEISKVKIKELEQSIKMLDMKQDEAYVKLDEIKLDKAVLNATMQQMQLIQTDIREIRNMMQTMHK